MYTAVFKLLALSSLLVQILFSSAYSRFCSVKPQIWVRNVSGDYKKPETSFQMQSYSSFTETQSRNYKLAYRDEIKFSD